MKLLGLLSVLALITALVFVQYKWGPDYTKTFSRLVAQKKASAIYYFVVFLAFLSTFSVFMVGSFVPQLGLPGLFVWIYFIGIISQLVCVTVPESGGVKTRIHLAAAGVMSASVFAQVGLLVLLTRLSLPGLVTCIVALLVMTSIWLAVIFKHRLARYELGLQSLYFVCYLGAVLVVSSRSVSF